MTDEDIERFWKRVDRRSEQECWPWLAGKNGPGYGVLYVDKRAVLAHRFSLAVDRGRAIPRGLFVLHGCDNPACVNPRHLRVGTHTENMQDAMERGRKKPPPKNFKGARPQETYGRGSKIGTSKLRETDIPVIFKKNTAGVSFKKLAKEYGVNPSTISDICRGRQWKHVARD